MERNLTWTKGIFDSNYQLFENGKISKSLNFNTWKSEATAFGTDKNYFFKDNGFFSATTQMLDENNQILGVINYEILNAKAEIQLNNGEKYLYHFTDNWFSRWLVSNLKGQQIKYNAATSSGQIYANTTDDLLIFAGLYIKEHYTKIFLFFIICIVFIPIIVS